MGIMWTTVVEMFRPKSGALICKAIVASLSRKKAGTQAPGMRGAVTGREVRRTFDPVRGLATQPAL